MTYFMVDQLLYRSIKTNTSLSKAKQDRQNAPTTYATNIN